MNSSRAIEKRLFMPDNMGFTHTDNAKFIYFSGSQSGARKTFGMSCEDLAELVKQFHAEYMKGKNPSQLKRVVEVLNNKIENLAVKLIHKRGYSDINEISDGLAKSGHIPIILSSITGAVQYGKAGRNLGDREVEYYCNLNPGAESQLREYLIKQDMMKSIATVINDIQKIRDTTNSSDPSFYACNKLISDLIEKLIKANQASMPNNYEQYDIYDTFKNKILEIITQFNLKVSNPFDDIAKIIISRDNRRTYNAQKSDSDAIYKVLQTFAKEKLGVDEYTENFELTDKQYDMLQNILPLIAYLNSDLNPFARNGLFGEEIMNAFHSEALKAYEEHESEETVHDYYGNDKKVQEQIEALKKSTASANDIEFNEDQLDQLVFGIELKKKNNPSTGFFGFAQKLITEGSASSREQPSESAQRRKILALPTPEVYLMLEAPPPKKGVAANRQ